jgi:hypothetical protein
MNDLSTIVLHKGLKGKGAARYWRKDLMEALVVIHSEMFELREQSKTIHGRTFYIEMYRRKTHGAATLRWRYVNGQHTTGQALPGSVLRLPKRLGDFYRDINELALLLNAQESVIRFALKQATKIESFAEHAHA